MKFRLLLVTLFIILLSNVVLAWDWSGTQSFDCDGCCVEDKTFSYTTTITNTGDDSFSVSKVYLRKTSGSTIASINTQYTLNPGNSKSFTLTGNIPTPSNGYLTYYVCFYLSEQRTYWWGGTYTYSDWSCSGTQNKQVTSKSNFQCFTDANCASDEYCYISPSCTSQCLTVSQGSCGHIVDHEWVNYECCSNANCASSKVCSNHYCVDISCTCGYISNHKCVKYECCSDSDCDYGYYCSDHSCLQYECMENNNCAYNEYCSNHNCVSLNCGYCEHIVNHNCIRYECCKDEECRDNQKCHNHLCEDLKCEYGFYASAHQCKKHECTVNNDCKDWQRCENNKCISVKCPSNQVIKYHGCEEIKNIHKILGYVKNNRYISFFSKEALKDFKIVYISIISGITLLTLGLIYILFIKKRAPIEKYIKKEEVKKKTKHKKKELKSKKKKFCNKCGYKTIGNEKYCRKCGNKL